MVSAVPGHYVNQTLYPDVAMQLNFGESAMWALVGLSLIAPFLPDLGKMGYQHLKLKYLGKY